MKRDYLLYAGAVVLFGGVVLSATEAPWTVTATAFVAAALLLLVAVLMVRPRPTLLVVGGRETDDLEPLHLALRADGFDLEPCPGNQDSACPVVAGKPCPAHGDPVGAVVIRHPDETQPLAPCGQAFHVPELAVEEDSNRELEVAGRYGRIGIERGPEAVTEALDRLLSGV